ncbi:(2Fe-2S)-binding protein, partial [Candidatus Bipolaricaulota bacterium]|nr:(2Fe-2S)-binding protein [Candidatus Bipolaricaulota bacterium]
MSEITLTIDDQPVTLEPGSSVLEACQELGIKIPTLCYHRTLGGYGACRLCLVEVEQNGHTDIQASCV